jgi:hypothetical protein
LSCLVQIGAQTAKRLRRAIENRLTADFAAESRITVFIDTILFPSMLAGGSYHSETSLL